MHGGVELSLELRLECYRENEELAIWAQERFSVHMPEFLNAKYTYMPAKNETFKMEV